MAEAKPRRVYPECEHEIWLRGTLPRQGDVIFCRMCDDYVRVGPPAGIAAGETLHDTWVSKPLDSGRFLGECLSCKYNATKRNFQMLKLEMETHYLYEHAESSIFGKVDRVPIARRMPIPKNSEPPF